MKGFIKTINKTIATVLGIAIVTTSGLAVTSRKVLAYNAGIEAFVNSLYSDCLGRNADPTGFNDWCNKLATGQITGKQAAYGFFFSPEFIAKSNQITDAELVEAYYRVFLNRASDEGGRNYWLTRISTTQYDINELFRGFADSTEFANKCASYGVTVGAHVDTPNVARTNGSLTAPDNPNSGVTVTGDFANWAMSYVSGGRWTGGMTFDTTTGGLTGFNTYAGVTQYNPAYPYVYGGTSPTSGIDCSGLNCYIANQYFGVTNMPHNMYQQAANYGTTIDPGQIQPGDIICDYGYSHGDIYFYVGRVQGRLGYYDYILRGQLSEDGHTYYPIITNFSETGYPVTNVDDFIAGDPAHRRIARIG